MLNSSERTDSHSSKRPPTGLLPSALPHSPPVPPATRSLFTAPIQVAPAGTSGPNASNYSKGGFADIAKFLEDARAGDDDEDNVIMNYKSDDGYDSQEEGSVNIVMEENEKRVSPVSFVIR